MFDRADTGTDRVLDAIGRLGMCHHESAGTGGLRHQHVELISREMSMLRIATRGQQATGCADLDHIGAGSHQLAYLASHLVGPVDDVVRHARIGVQFHRHVSTTDIPTVAVPAGLRQHRDRDLHPRPFDQALLLRFLHTQIGPARLTNCRDARGERASHALRREVEAHRERRLDIGRRREVTIDHEVHVTVEETRRDEMTREIDRFVAVQPHTDVDDATFLHRDVGHRGVCACAVEDHSVRPDRSAHGQRVAHLDGRSRTRHRRCDPACHIVALARWPHHEATQV